MQVDHDVRRSDQLVEEGTREHLRVRTVVRARKAAVEVLAVFGHDERRAALKRLHAHDRDGGDRPAELVRLELVHDSYHGADRRVLAAVHTADQRKMRPFMDPARLERRMLDPGEPLVREDDGATLDHESANDP